MCQMRWKGPGPYGVRLLVGNKMCELTTKSQGLRKILRSLQKRKRYLRWKTSGMSFLEARKRVGTYMGEISYAPVARRTDTINQDNIYRALVEKSIQLKSKDWPKFQKQRKNLHSAELQTQPRPVRTNKEKASETTKVKSPTNLQTNKN